MGKKGVDIRDVAALAGVSLGSASRVINRADTVSSATREKVERAIKILGYRPNHAAQALRSRSSKTIGCLFTDVTNPLYANVFRALEDRLRVDEYMLLLANGLNDAQREIETLDLFARRGMDGVIAAPDNEHDPKVVAALNSLTMPVVLMDRDVRGASLDTVLFDHANGVKEAVAHFLGIGHRRIALVLGAALNCPARRRIEGYRAAYQAAGIAVPEGLVVQDPSIAGSVYPHLCELLKQPSPPTAVLAQGAYALGSTIQAASANGLRIPQDLSVVAIGDTPFARDHNPPISLLSVDSAGMAELTSRLLRSRMAEPDQVAHVEKVPVTFLDRGSVVPPARR